MAYNRKNYLKHVRYIIDVYAASKDADTPDTKIIKTEFPKKGIYISYSQWMRIKNMKLSQIPPTPQLAMFN